MTQRRELPRRDFLAYLTTGASGLAGGLLLGNAAAARASTTDGGVAPVEGSSAATPHGVNDVRAFGATGDGETDDTEALQAAAAATPAGGVMLLPPGLYIVSDTIPMPPHASIMGTGLGDLTTTGISALTVMGSLFQWADDTAAGVFVRDLTIAGPRGLGGGDVGAGELGSCGLDFGLRGANLSLSNLYIDGFTNAIVLREQQTLRIDHVTANNPGNHGLACLGVAVATITGGLFGNASDPTDHAAGIYVAALDDVRDSSFIRFLGVTVDESIGNATSLYLRSGTDLLFSSGLVYIYEGEVGILIGDGDTGNPQDVTITDTVVMPYGTHAAANTIKIMPGALRTTLDNVKTRTPHGGGDIDDQGTDTVQINVNQSGTIS